LQHVCEQGTKRDKKNFKNFFFFFFFHFFFVFETGVLQELSGLQKESIEDVVLCAPDESGGAGVLDVVLFGSAGTPYEGGQFRVRLQIGPEYPAAPPKGFFLTKIFHPNVSKVSFVRLLVCFVML
jgi:ubiquitin-protein ligase